MFVQAVARARDAICAVVRLRRDDAGAVRLDVSGTAWAAGSPTTFVTAKHVVNPRPEGQRWYVVRRTSPASTALEIWPVEEILVEPAEVAARLKLSRATIYVLVERGELVAQRIGWRSAYGITTWRSSSPEGSPLLRR